jgi:hypothetical protein
LVWETETYEFKKEIAVRIGPANDQSKTTSDVNVCLMKETYINQEKKKGSLQQGATKTFTTFSNPGIPKPPGAL